jgi:hypothetical protein
VFLSGSRQPSRLDRATMDAGGVTSPMYRLGVALVLVAATLVLAGCGQERPATPTPGTAPPARTVPPPTLSPATTLLSSPPRLLRKVGGYSMFEVNAEQYEIIGKHVYQVLFRDRLWDQGVRFGANYVPEKHLHFVLIDPGFSRLTARQILDRLLGII